MMQKLEALEKRVKQLEGSENPPEQSEVDVEEQSDNEKDLDVTVEELVANQVKKETNATNELLAGLTQQLALLLAKDK